MARDYYGEYANYGLAASFAGQRKRKEMRLRRERQEAMQGCQTISGETEEQSRQRFEEWLVSRGKDRRFIVRDHNGLYISGDHESQWQAWRASQTFGKGEDERNTQGD